MKTDTNGNYSMVVEAGTYDITVFKRPEYEDNTATGIKVTPNNVTIRDFVLTLKPTGTISCQVINAP